MDNSEILKWKVLNAVNYISLVAAVVTCVVLVALGFFKYKYVDRVSLRFQGFIALIDIARHLSQMVLGSSNETICQAIGFFINFTDLLYVLLNLAIALNIQLLLIHHVRPNKRLQWYYGLVSVGVAFFLNSIALVSGKFGKIPNGHCRLRGDNIIVWKSILVYSINIPGLLYCLVMFFSVVLQVRHKKLQLRMIRGSESNLGKDPFKFVWTLYFRVSLYPLSCFITLFPYTLRNLLFDSVGFSHPALVFALFFCRRITGTLNFITMLSDPHCQTALKHFWDSLFSSKSSRTSPSNDELPPLPGDENLSAPFHHELEYPNGDRVRLNDYIRFI